MRPESQAPLQSGDDNHITGRILLTFLGACLCLLDVAKIGVG
jgi:hypothetical protein